jgi:H+-transporting ATP synthase F0 complex subunit s
MKPENLSGSREFWAWINIMFNRVDKERQKLGSYQKEQKKNPRLFLIQISNYSVGPDRCAAEWLLKNGSCVRYTQNPQILHCNYNSLPPESVRLTLKEIEATNAGIMHIGFDHLENCFELDRIVLKDCGYIDDLALEKLELRKESLKILEIEKCRDITDHGLMQLKKLENLKELKLVDLPYVKNPENCEKELKNALKNCKFEFNIK